MSEVCLKNYSTGDYDPGPPAKRAVWLLVSRIFFETSIPWPSSLKSNLLRGFGANVGNGVVIKPRVKIKYPWFLDVGDDCWLGEHCWIDNLAQVSLGESVVISQQAYLLTGSHDYKAPGFDLITSPIEIGDGGWIGAKATVCPGVVVGELAVLALGSVASSDLEAKGIYRGNPAEKIRNREIRADD